MLIFKRKKRIPKEIIIHVGLHKTGSTSIQRTLYENRNKECFKKRKYLYPASLPFNHSEVFYSMFCKDSLKYHMNIKKSYTNKQISKLHKKWENDLKDEANSKRYKKIIISGEDISVLSRPSLLMFKNLLENIIGNAKFRIIFYVRHPVSWVKSVAFERQKNGIHIEPQATKISYSSIIKSFADIFGKKSLEIHNFDEACKCKHGITGHFLDKVLDLGKNEIKTYYANESGSQLAYELCKFVNIKQAMIVDGSLNEPFRKLDDLLPIVNHVKGKKFDLSPQQKREVFNNCSEEIRWLDDNMGIKYSLNETIDNEQQNDCNSSHPLNEEGIIQIKNVYEKLTPFVRKCIDEYLAINNKGQEEIHNS